TTQARDGRARASGPPIPTAPRHTSKAARARRRRSCTSRCVQIRWRSKAYRVVNHPEAEHLLRLSSFGAERRQGATERAKRNPKNMFPTALLEPVCDHCERELLASNEARNDNWADLSTTVPAMSEEQSSIS